MANENLLGPAVDKLWGLKDNNNAPEANEEIALDNFDKFKESSFKTLDIFVKKVNES